MTKLGGLVRSWVYGVALVGVWAGCAPRTDLGVGSDEGGGGDGLPSSQAGSGGGPIGGEGGSPEGGSPGSHAGSGAPAGGDMAGRGNGGSTMSGGVSGNSGTGSDSGGTDTGGTSGSAGTGGSSGNETGGTSGTGGSGSWGDGELLCGTLGNLDASSGLLLDLGLTGPVAWMERADDRLLATAGGNWALWDLNDKTVLARGRAPAGLYGNRDLAGDLFALVYSTRLEVRSLLDGSLITTIATPDNAENQGGLSPDGSYYWSGTADSIKAWDASGTLLLTKNGDYTLIDNSTEPFGVVAAPDELRIARGPAGSGVIEHISIDTGVSTTSSFAGSFLEWFLDGGRFLTSQGGTIRVYDADTATQEALVAPPSYEEIGGQGDYFWTVGPGLSAKELTIYAVAEPSSPVAKYALDTGVDSAAYPNGRTYYPVGNRIGLIHKTDVTVVELDPTGVTDSTVDLPDTTGNWMYTIDAAGNFAFASQNGVIYDGADLERALNCGQVSPFAGSEQGTLAVATSLGLMLFELAPGSRRYVGRIPYPSNSVSLSSDGSVLAATSLHGLSPKADATSLAIWSLPDRTSILTFPYSPSFGGVTLSALGNRFSFLDGTGRHVQDFDGNISLTLSDLYISGTWLSPDGSRVAVRLGRPPTSHYSTQIYENGTLIDAFRGGPLLWLDQDHLLVNAYDPNRPDLQRGAMVYAIPGGFQPGPQLGRFDGGYVAMLSQTEIYSGPSDNSVYSLTTGELLWSGPAADRAAVASDNIVYAIGYQVMFSAY